MIDYTAARKEWKDLGRPCQREIIRLAKRGEIHPDHRIARIAYRWAASRLPKAYSQPERAIRSVLWLALDLATGGGPVLLEWKTNRTARRIVRATEKNSRDASLYL